MDYPRLSELTGRRRQDDTTQDALNFLRLAALHHTGAHRTTEYILSEYPTTRTARTLRTELEQYETKAAVPSATTTNGPWAGNLLPPLFAEAITARLAAQTVLAKVPFVPAPLLTPIPYESTPGLLDFVGEGKPKPAAALPGGTLMLTPAKLARIVILSNELLKSSDAGAIIEARLTAAATTSVDMALLDPARGAVPGLSPGSITSQGTLVTAGATVAASVQSLMNSFAAARPGARGWFITSPQGLTKLNGGAVLPQGPLQLAGVPIVVAAAPANVLALVDPAGVYVSDQDTMLDESRYALIEANTAPADPPTGSTVLIDLWQTNQTGLLVERHVSWVTEVSATHYVVLP